MVDMKAEKMEHAKVDWRADVLELRTVALMVAEKAAEKVELLVLGWADCSVGLRAVWMVE